LSAPERWNRGRGPGGEPLTNGATSWPGPPKARHEPKLRLVQVLETIGCTRAMMHGRQREGYSEDGVRRRRVDSCAAEGGRGGDMGAARRGTPCWRSSMALAQRLSRASGLLMLCVPPLSTSTCAQRGHTPRSRAPTAVTGALIGCGPSLRRALPSCAAQQDPEAAAGFQFMYL
jgi:hypothetical protein